MPDFKVLTVFRGVCNTLTVEKEKLMLPKLSRYWKKFPLLHMAILVSFACQTLTGCAVPGSQTPTIPASEKVTQTSVLQTPDVATQPAVLQTPGVMILQENVVYGPGSFILLDTQTGLTDLKSYKAALKLAFDGSEAGQPSKWSKTYDLIAIKDPAARQLTIENTGESSNSILMAEMDGAAYERQSENDCSATILDPDHSLAINWEPAGFLTGVTGAEKVGNETVNDVKADHYTFDQRAFGPLPPAQSTGELWVASEGGYILKYLLTTKGTAEYFGVGIEGTLTWDYELSDVNAALTFVLPENCPAGIINVPQLPDASNILNMPGVLSYDTASNLTTAAEFYQKQIPGLGWTMIDDPAITETSETLNFTKGNQTMMLILTVGDHGTTVQVLLGK